MPLPDTGRGLVIRTDFTDPAAWEAVAERVAEGFAEEHGGPGGGDPLLDLVDDEEFSGLTPERARLLAVGTDFREAVFLADSTTMGAADRMLLAVAGHREEDHVWRFRVKPESVQRMVLMFSTKFSFEDYLDEVDDNGVYAY